MAPRLHIITASTRPGRVGPTVADWVAAGAKANGKFEVVPVDLAQFALPVYDEPRHPIMQKYEHAHTKKWAESVAAADAFVFVTPEYNFTMPPSLLNALNYVFSEWNYKAAGIVSYGGISGGLRAAQTLKLILTTFKVVPINEGVVIPMVTNSIQDGKFVPNDVQAQALPAMLDELRRWTDALAVLRKPK